MRKKVKSLAVCGLLVVAVLGVMEAGSEFIPRAEGKRIFLGEYNDSKYILLKDNEGHIYLQEKDEQIENASQTILLEIDETGANKSNSEWLFLILLFMMIIMIVLLSTHMLMHRKGEDRKMERNMSSLQKENSKPSEKVISEQKKQQIVEEEIVSLPLALTVLDSIYHNHGSEESMPIASMGTFNNPSEAELKPRQAREVGIELSDGGEVVG